MRIFDREVPPAAIALATFLGFLQPFLLTFLALQQLGL